VYFAHERPVQQQVLVILTARMIRLVLISVDLAGESRGHIKRTSANHTFESSQCFKN